ncbi:MAG TPA: hypothetical protein VHB69_01315 [Mycobacteriales bacterium]|nr:hypothetical protein [Mycobacteriales bacterium]
MPAPPIKSCGAARSVTATGDVVVLVETDGTPRCPSAAAAYNPLANTWTKLSAPPASLRGQLTATQNLYVSQRTGAAAVLNLRSGTWHSLPPVPEAGALTTVVSGTTQAVVLGAGPNHDQVFAFNGTKWIPRASLPHPGTAIDALAAYSAGRTQWALATEERTFNSGFSSQLRLLRLNASGWTREPNLPGRPAVVTSVQPLGDRQLVAGGNCPPYASCPPAGIELGIANLRSGQLHSIGQSPLGFALDAAVVAGEAVVGLDTDSEIGDGAGHPAIRPLSSSVYDVATGRWLSGPRDNALADVTGTAWTPSGLVVVGSPRPGCSCQIGGLILRPAMGHGRAPSPYPAVSTTDSPPNLTPAAWPRNTSGQTYGSAMGITVPADLPDLISVIASNGRPGYVHKAPYLAAIESAPANPQIAATESPRPATLPVYAEDGHTRIGVFVIGSSSK